MVVFINFGGKLQVKKLRAKNEKEASEADLVASKMQVDAAEEAEETKKRIHKSY